MGQVVRVAGMHRCLRKKHKRMVVGAMAHEVAQAGAHLGFQGLRHPRTKVKLVGNFKAEQATVKVHRLGHRCDIDAEVPQAAHLKRPWQAQAVHHVRG